MVMEGKYGAARKPRRLEIMCISLGAFFIFSLFFMLNYISRQHHSPSSFNFDSAVVVIPHQRWSVLEKLMLYQYTTHVDDAEAKVFNSGDRTLGGLLLPPQDYELGQCISRSEESLIRKSSPHRPSSYLITKLRQYEARHKRCAPKAVKFSQNGTNSDLGDCQFVLWIANSGLGNRMITIASAFVYSLLTDRVLLLDHAQTDIAGLFCEPFPGVSWLLPENYDYQWMNKVTWENDHRLGYLLQSSGFANVTLPTPVPNGYVFLNLMHNNDEHDKRFFCKRVQKQLRKVPLLYWRSNNYLVPGLHFDHSFRSELDRMFPERDTVFHHVSRYLFRPSNFMWGLVLRFRQPYLASARRQVGLQLRVLESNVTSSVVADQLLSCVLERKLLPEQSPTAEEKLLLSAKTGSISVLVASLDDAYYDRLRGYYMDLPVEGADYIGVHTPSKEKTQQFGFDHDKKAWADMYLLSLSDTLVTSPWSTFGYVAQALAGTTPWILTKTQSNETAEASFQTHGHCNRAASMEPCFHAPPELNCDVSGNKTKPDAVLHFIKPCEDVVGGVKIMPSFVGDQEGKNQFYQAWERLYQAHGSGSS